jgi:hypothetical protein
MLHKICLTLAAFAILFGWSANSLAQTKKSTSKVKGRFEELIKTAREGKSKANREIVEEIKAVYDEEKTENLLGFGSIVGTWNVTVPVAEGNFYALQTFNVDGTFTETSSLLGMLPEGPSHGVWEYRRRGTVLTFELFAFDPGTGESVGRLRVRNFIQLTDGNRFASDYVLDFIELDGTVIENIGSGTFTGERLQVRGL